MLLPGTDLEVQVFPTILRCGNKEIPLAKSGPLKGFTVTQDLEKGRLLITGQGLKKVVSAEDFGYTLEKPNLMRLSLGMDKAQDIDLIWRRQNLEELLPLIFHLAQWVPASVFPDVPEDVDLLNWCNARFTSMLVPRLFDDDYQGLGMDIETKTGIKPLDLILGLFIREEEGVTIPRPIFHAGRLLNVRLSNGDVIDLEWSKKQIRRIVWHPEETREIHLNLQRGIRSFRANKERVQRGNPLSLEKGKSLILDRFEK